MRVAFMTDQHFDVSSRWDETLRIANWCEEKCRELKPDVIALGGDMFERRPNPTEVKAVCEHVQRLANIAPVVGVYGNHDVAESLAPLNLLEAEHKVSIVDSPDIMTIGSGSDRICMQLLPWPKRAHLLASAGDAGRDEAGQQGYALLQNVLRYFGTWGNPNVPTVFVGHVQLAGSRVSTGQPLAPGADFELGLGDLALAGADAYLLGHIHLPQEWSINGAPVLMGGSTRRTAYGELEDKYLTVVDIEAGRPAVVERLVIPTTPMMLLESKDPAEFDWGCIPDNVFGAEVRLRYRCKRETREQARAMALRARDALLAGGALTVKLDEQVEPETRTRQTVELETLTPEQRLQNHWQRKGFNPGERRDALIGKFREVQQ